MQRLGRWMIAGEQEARVPARLGAPLLASLIRSAQAHASYSSRPAPVAARPLSR
jgi:hypothetical protein